MPTCPGATFVWRSQGSSSSSGTATLDSKTGYGRCALTALTLGFNATWDCWPHRRCVKDAPGWNAMPNPANGNRCERLQPTTTNYCGRCLIRPQLEAIQRTGDGEWHPSARGVLVWLISIRFSFAFAPSHTQSREGRWFLQQILLDWRRIFTKTVRSTALDTWVVRYLAEEGVR